MTPAPTASAAANPTDRADRTARADRRLAAASGALYLLTFVSSIVAYFLITPVLTDPGYIVGAGADTQVLVGSLLDLVNALACIGTAVAVFPVLRRVHEATALGFVMSRALEAAIILVGVLALFAVVTLRQPDAPDAEARAAIGQALVALRDWSFVFGPGLIPALNAVLFGALLYRARLVPRVIPLLGLIGAPLLASSTIGIMLGVNHEGSPWQTVTTVPIFVWELSVGAWMLFRGFDRTALRALAAVRS